MLGAMALWTRIRTTAFGRCVGRAAPHCATLRRAAPHGATSSISTTGQNEPDGHDVDSERNSRYADRVRLIDTFAGAARHKAPHCAARRNILTRFSKRTHREDTRLLYE